MWSGFDTSLPGRRALRLGCRSTSNRDALGCPRARGTVARSKIPGDVRVLWCSIRGSEAEVELVWWSSARQRADNGRKHEVNAMIAAASAGRGQEGRPSWLTCRGVPWRGMKPTRASGRARRQRLARQRTRCTMKALRSSPGRALLRRMHARACERHEESVCAGCLPAIARDVDGFIQQRSAPFGEHG